MLRTRLLHFWPSLHYECDLFFPRVPANAEPKADQHSDKEGTKGQDRNETPRRGHHAPRAAHPKTRRAPILTQQYLLAATSPAIMPRR
jgi:hypothetical protein